MSDRKLQCFLIGSESLLLHCAERLQESGHEVLGVISDAAPILAWCTERSVRAIPLHSAYIESLRAQPFDYLLSITNRTVVPPDALALPQRGAINFHDGPLPRYGGLHAPSWALMAAEPEHGITWHTMTSAVDEGDIVLQRHFPIAADDTALTLNARCFEAGLESFPELLECLSAERWTCQPQALDRQTFHSLASRPSALAVLDWSAPVAVCSAQLRALDFGNYANSLACARIVANGHSVRVGRLLRQEPDVAEAGTILSAELDALSIAALDGTLVLTGFTTEDGAALSAVAALAVLGLKVGDVIPPLAPAVIEALDAFSARVSRYEDAWAERLASLEPLELPADEHASEAPPQALRLMLAPSRDRDAVAASFVIFLARLCGRTAFDVALYEHAEFIAEPTLASIISARVPLRISLTTASSVAEAHESVAQSLRWVRRRGGFTRDSAARRPVLRAFVGHEFSMPLTIAFVDRLEDYPVSAGGLTLVLARNGATAWDFDSTQLSSPRIATMVRQFTAALAADAMSEWRALPLMSASERRLVLQDWAAAGASAVSEAESAPCVHEFIAKQAARTPSHVALICGDEQFTYSELDKRSNQLAHHLQSLGAGPDSLVAVCCDRSLEMMVAVLGVLKAGAAYVPIDPTYPAERVTYMLEDAQARILLTRESVLGYLPSTRATTICVDRDWAEIAQYPDVPPATAVTAAHLAYCIYTSGSTGRPKGVMVEHRNVANLFAALDARLGTKPGVWLAVTSLSFDISVLELFWTLARGYTVVLQQDVSQQTAAGLALSHAHKPVDFSLFYFSADENENASDRYRILMEGARFGDEHGFTAVWTPERHFHAFGGLYPNPAVTGAAIAAVTKRIGVRAGSCVLPLHHPIRVAEEWAMVDNLSGGRVGVSFAAGWQPNDFVLNPAAFAEAKSQTVEMMETVRRLWRGEWLMFPGPRGDVSVRTLPRPVQPELPIWFTTAGNPESYELAGQLGVNVLTHLLGQTIDELADKITLYRKSWRAHGHAGEGKVSLMLHTFVGDSDEDVKEIVRAPMKAYLGSSISLIKGFAETFPTFKQKPNGSSPALDFQSLDDAEMDALLDYSFERYYATSGMFGTEATCARTVDRLKGVGVDDIACLIDFGVETETVLKHLKHLSRVRSLTARELKPRTDTSLASLIAKHQVTHLQCTPSLAQLLVESTLERDALRTLQALCVGGEALAPGLAAELQRVVAGDVHNMYGPTETTVWSAMHTLNGEGPRIPLGVPLANNELYVLDAFRQPVPPGTPGELFIGGAQVVRGYWRRPDLTAERFVPNPFGADRSGRLYRTGDVVRWRHDGKLEFLGRSDRQVKVRGHRVELGEIESALMDFHGLREAVVTAQPNGDSGMLLVAYVVWRAQADVAAQALRTHLRTTLPSVMVPTHFVNLSTMPRTPNGKIDRNRLPAVAQAQTATVRRAAPVAASGALEQAIAGVWQDVLQVPEVGMLDNFFDLGGHSLLAVKVHSRLKLRGHHELAITDLFRFPTVRSLAAFLHGTLDDKTATRAQAQAAQRREMMDRRSQLPLR